MKKRACSDCIHYIPAPWTRWLPSGEDSALESECRWGPPTPFAASAPHRPGLIVFETLPPRPKPDYFCFQFVSVDTLKVDEEVPEVETEHSESYSAGKDLARFLETAHKGSMLLPAVLSLVEDAYWKMRPEKETPK